MTSREFELPETGGLMPDFTPGPWYVWIVGGPTLTSPREEGWVVVAQNRVLTCPDPSGSATARLIAKAPEMYGLLRALIGGEKATEMVMNEARPVLAEIDQGHTQPRSWSQAAELDPIALAEAESGDGPKLYLT